MLFLLRSTCSTQNGKNLLSSTLPMLSTAQRGVRIAPRDWDAPVYNMKSHEILQARGFEKAFQWPYREKRYTKWHSLLDRDPTVDKFYENTKLICVEGNVGVGKSQLAKRLAEQFDMKHFGDVNLDILDEMKYGWPLKDFNHLLPDSMKRRYAKDFFGDAKNLGANGNMQVQFLAARLFQYTEALLHLLSTGQGCVIEGSPFSDFVYLEAMYKSGYVSKGARQFYYVVQQNALPDRRLLKPHLVIYLDAPVDTCLERIKSRGKEWQTNSPVLSKQYLQTIETEYKTTFLNSLRRWCLFQVYDWQKFGDAEIVAQDLEAIDFDKYQYYFETELKDWRNFDKDFEWDRLRAELHDRKDMVGTMISEPTNYFAPEMYVHHDDMLEYNAVRDAAQRAVTGRDIEGKSTLGAYWKDVFSLRN